MMDWWCGYAWNEKRRMWMRRFFMAKESSSWFFRTGCVFLLSAKPQCLLWHGMAWHGFGSDALFPIARDLPLGCFEHEVAADPGLGAWFAAAL
jgi:hypothetical protein